MRQLSETINDAVRRRQHAIGIGEPWASGRASSTGVDAPDRSAGAALHQVVLPIGGAILLRAVANDERCRRRPRRAPSGQSLAASAVRSRNGEPADGAAASRAETRSAHRRDRPRAGAVSDSAAQTTSRRIRRRTRRRRASAGIEGYSRPATRRRPARRAAPERPARSAQQTSGASSIASFGLQGAVHRRHGDRSDAGAA